MSRATELLALPATLNQDQPIGTVLEGIVIAGSWDAATATCQIQEGSSSALGLIADGNDQPLVVQVTLATAQLGDQYAPVGGERVTLLRNGSGWIAFFEHADDDSQQVPSGERWIAHRNAAGAVDSYVKHTNDGPTPGDGLGAHLSNGGALHRASTSGGRSITQDDTAKKITVKGAGSTPHARVVDDNAATLGIKDTTAGGLTAHLDDVLRQIRHQAATNLETIVDAVLQRITHQSSATVYTIVDGAGNAISHVVGAGGLVGLGALAASIPATGALIRNTELSDLISGGSLNVQGLNALRLDDLEKLVAAMIAAGVPSAGAILADLATLIQLKVAPGSAIVRSL